jgi:hypothetical protein
MFRLEFTICGNPDRGQGDWEESHSLEAPTMNELRAAVRAFQYENNIGGGNWGEAVLTQDRSVVGYMSYNTRVWNSQKYTDTTKEVNI